MQALSVMDVAARHARWVAVRQAAVAGNIANAGVAGFRPSDAVPFTAATGGATRGFAGTLAATQPGHVGFAAGPGQAGAAPAGVRAQAEATAVSLEREVARAGAVKREGDMNLAVTAAFHRLLMTAARG